MKVAVLSDIHANLEALEAVWADLAPRRPEEVVCLGDLVGYGPDPEAVVEFVRQRGLRGVQGNHEAALIDTKMRNWMNFQARENHIATEALLSAEALEYCRSLPRSLEIEGALFVHGLPPDSVLKYLYRQSERELLALFEAQPHRIFFVGHTHELALVSMSDGQVRWQRPDLGLVVLQPEARYLVNSGSVGQPRGRLDGRATYLIWDSERCELELRGVSYDARATAAKIIARGFPRAFADRLG